MPWQDNSGNNTPNNRGPQRGPWGQPPRGPGNGGPTGPGGGRGEPPDLEELLNASRQRLKKVFPRGADNGRSGDGPRPPQLTVRNAALGAAGLLALWLVSGFYTVGASDLGIVTTPGLHWRAPSPIQNVDTVSVTIVRSTTVPRAPAGQQREGLMLTRDKNIVDIGVTVQWRIKGDVTPGVNGLPAVAQFAFLIDNPERMLTTIAEAAIREIVGRNELDFVQTEGRTVVQDETRTLMQQTLDAQNTGIEIVAVNLEKTDPPTPEVNAAFLDVIAAAQDREQYINTSRAYQNRVVPEARGQAQRILEEATAYSSRVTAEARGQAQRFDAIREEYAKAPDVTRQRMYLETIEKVLGPMNKIIIEENTGPGVVPYLPLNQLQRTENQ